MNTAYGVLCLISGFIAAYTIRNLIAPENFQSGRHANLNGLRGFLSLIMFVCHASTWQQYLADGRWRISDSPSLIIPGQTGIVLFFMITGFLFAKKYLDKKNQEIDWIKTYCSRILRLYPAYLGSMAILIAIISIKKIKLGDFTKDFELTPYIQWILFTIPGAPPLNKFQETNIIMVGVTWSLVFEWAFYFSLPMIAAILGTKKSWRAIFLCAIPLITTLYLIPFYGLVYFMIFIGILCAIFDKYTKFQNILNKKIFSIAALAILITNGFVNNETSYTGSSITAIGFAFVIFSSGNDLFGFLNKKSTQVFGMGTYSIYLLHGPLLYLTFTTTQTSTHKIIESNELFWAIIILISPILVLLSTFSYVFIEAPAMKYQEKLAKLIHTTLQFASPFKVKHQLNKKQP